MMLAVAFASVVGFGGFALLVWAVYRLVNANTGC
jgi:hypothetical protein